MRSILLAAAILTTAVAHAQTWTDPATWARVPDPIATKDIVYADPADPNFDAKAQTLDVYRNATATAATPVLVYMHGGAWNHGQRPESWHGFRAWLAAGFSVVTVDYRMADAHPAPAALQDVGCVLSWIDRNAATYHFDTHRIVTYGTSAGGHLALLAAVLPANNAFDLPRCKPQPRIAAVLDFYGPYHLEPSIPGAFTSKSVARWIGPNPQPTLEAEEHALSPSTYIRKGIPPVFLAQGDSDPTVPYASSQQLHHDLDAAGIKNVFDTIPGGKHGGWPPEENQRVQLDSLRFLQSIGVIR